VEREWRKVGNLSLGSHNYRNVVAAFAPEDDHWNFQKDLAAAIGRDVDWVERKLHFLDPTWGLERMIARLAGIEDWDAGPFT